MKLRIQGNSLRIRLSRSELARFAATGSLEETIIFGPAAGSELTYGLAIKPALPLLGLISEPGKVTVLVPAEMGRCWAEGPQVGISGTVDLGIRGTLSVLIEKDFACADGSEAANQDAFPNPRMTHVYQRDGDSVTS